MNDPHPALSICYLKLNVKQIHHALVAILLFIVALVFTTQSFATESLSKSPDPQKVWKNTCSSCHGDSADIAQNHLKVVDGELQGPMHKATFKKFLTNHYLSQTKADAVYAMLLSQATAKSRFEQECSSCHQTTADFVQESMEVNNGTLYSKKLGTPTRDFLQTHQNLNAADIDYFMKHLTVVGYEIYLPNLAE